MADLSRIAFFTSAVAGALGLAFAVGAYSVHKQNAIGRAAVGLYEDAQTLIQEIPNITRSRPVHFLMPARYRGSGVTVNRVATDDLVLLSGFMGDEQKVRLMRRDGRIVNEWRLKFHELLPDAGQCRKAPMTDWNISTHDTLIQPDGSIVLGFESCGMVKLDRCGGKLWATREITHHSPNFLHDGRIVIAGATHVTSRAPWPIKSPYWEDLIRIYDANGRLVRERKITQLLLENGLASTITATGDDDATVDGEFHLNEVEELPERLASAFPMFEAGDLLVSLRNLNMVLVTDADARRVKWYKIGPWIRQHDPDWQADGRITVFDNHRDPRGSGSRIVAIDPRTGQTETLYGGRKDQFFFTPERGLHQLQPDGGLLIAEANYGRAFQVDRSGGIVWEYVNRFDDADTAWLSGASAYPRSYFNVADWSCRKGEHR